MGNYKCEIMLEQYTPMVHFQHDEPGACLRASEVKPKLDKYVLAWLSRQKIKDTDLPANWSDAQDEHASAALRYKMRFSAARSEEKPDHPLFFGNQGKDVQQKKLIWNGVVNMTLVCLVDTKIKVALPGQTEKECTLLEILKSLIPSFFETHCFGTRSNKGFGSFCVNSIDRKTDFCRIALNQDLLPPECEQAYFMAYKKGTTDGMLLLDDVYILSSLMKGGVNRPSYFKSQLHQAVHMSSRYEETAKDEARASEKAFMKQRVFSSEDIAKYNRICKEGHEIVRLTRTPRYYYYRALLGLAGTYSFWGKDRNNAEINVRLRTIKVVVEDESERELSMDEKGKKGKKIGRFPNPVVFKPCPDGLLVMLKSIPEPLKKARFIFGQTEETIELPEFDLKKFVEDCLFSCVNASGAPKWTGWKEVKEVRIFRRNTKYGPRMDNFASVTRIVEKTAADEGRK